MLNVEMDSGKTVLLMGNEAIARGAIEAGVDFCTAYPGTPSSEIIDTLAKVASRFSLYVEWSTNEKVALEAAGGASFAGLRSICAMKHQGVNVCSDFIFSTNLAGTHGGFVLVACDDPSAHSSTQEEDTRNFARFADIPLLEPSNVQEAKEMTKWAFDLSERLKVLCMIRSVTRVSHARGNVKLDEIKREKRSIDLSNSPYSSGFPSISARHSSLHEKLDRAEEEFNRSAFNEYFGPDDASIIIITSGTGWMYSREAVKILGLDEIGILKLGTTWPVPEKLVLTHLKHADEVLIVEETDSFLEQNVKVIAAENRLKINFYGKRSRDIGDIGEINVDIVINALKRLKGIDYTARNEEYVRITKKLGKALPPRMLSFCAGCPHRASLWAIKRAIRWDGRDAYVCGDIGCYSMGIGPTGFMQLKTLHCMGAGIGVANGLGNLRIFGFDRPIIAIAGDSTFYHACIPALINAKHNGASILFIILDNCTTAMTGFQPHPGVAKDAMDRLTPIIKLEDVCRGIGLQVEISDPFEIKKTTKTIYEMLQLEGTRVIILRRACGIAEAKRKRVYVDQTKCIGEECGCVRFCSRVFNCPGIMWDERAGKARIDEVVCNGCGACAQLCPRDAIVVDE